MKGVLFVVVLLCSPCAVFAYTPSEPINIVYNVGIAPIKFTDREGQPSGILNEYWKLLSQKSGLNFAFHEVETFSESLDLIRHGQADLHAGVFFTEERSNFLEYSQPIFDLKFHIYASADLTPPESLKNTRGVLVGVVSGGYPAKHIETVVPARYVIKYKNYKAMFESVLNGDLKVFVSSDIHLNYYLSINNLDNPFKHSGNVLFEQTYYGATAKQNHALMEMVRQGQEKLSQEDKQRLKEHWLNYKVKDANIPPLESLTQREINWINDHPVLKVANEKDWPPFDFNKQGQHMGLSIDLLELISDRVGIKFKYVHGYSWNELLEMIRNKKIDIIHSLNRSELREKFILFTDPYISNQTVIVTTKENTNIKSISDLSHKKIAVIDGYHQKQVLKKKVEDVDFVSVESPIAALRAVSSGRVDATIRFNSVASYLINQHLLTNLKYVNEFNIMNGNLQDLHIGVRNDWPILQSILQKGLESITLEEMNALKQKWISFEPESPEKSRIEFTQAEKEWINSHPKVTLGADFNWPPFDFTDEKGLHTGISADYIALIEQRSGIKINVQVGVWSEILEQMKKGALDGLACAVQTDERKAYLAFSTPYLNVPTAIVTKNDNKTIHNLHDLRGKTVSINKSSYMHEWMKDRYPQIKLHLSSSNEESIEAVSYGEVDAYIGNLAVASYIIRERLLTNLKVVKKLENMQTQMSVAIDKSQLVLMGIVEKVLENLTAQERRTIMERWYVAATEKKVALTKLERQWIARHPVIRMSGDPAWAPMAYRNDQGQYVGIVSDYFKLIEAKSGLRFELVPLENWSEVLNGYEDRKIDVINAITGNSEHRKIMDFTDVFMTANIVFITRDDVKFISGFENIGDMRISTVKDHITELYIRTDYPGMDLELFPTASAGLKALSAGNVDVFVTDIPAFEYYTKKSSLANLKISGLTPYTHALSIGVKKDNPELVSILNKSLGLITQKETNEIYNNWVTLKEPLIDYSLLVKVALIACLCLAAIGYWNRRLAHEATLRKAAEAKALQAARTKSEFLANMSHEIRTPMNSVLGFAELLDNMITDPEQKNYLKSIRSGGSALLGIINDILDLSKIEAGKMPLKPDAFSLANMFEEMNDFFKNRMAQKQLAFNYELATDFPPHILIDGIRLRQVLINLIGNALKFTEAGRVDLICSDVRMGDDGRHVGFTISVTDTGIGIRKAQQEGIFNKFEQQEGQDSVKYGGTGLGLSICKSLTFMMGGTINVTSEPGKGSSFVLDFADIPVTEKTTAQRKHELLSPSAFSISKILIVDDIRDNRTLLAAHFKGSKVQIYEADNGEAALQQLRQIQVDLIFLDLRMPVMNGYETITAIRIDEKLQHIPVVAVTASVLAEDVNKVDQYGFNGYLHKPVQRQAMFRLAAQFLPYDLEKAPAGTDTVPDFPEIPTGQLDRFLKVTEKELFPEWHTVKDRGDFNLIGDFASQVKQLAMEYEIHRMIHYAEKLELHVSSFDILEVDSLMKQFPSQVEALQ